MLLQKLILLKSERNKLRVNIRIAIYDIKQNSSIQTKFLEKKAAILEEMRGTHMKGTEVVNIMQMRHNIIY